MNPPRHAERVRDVFRSSGSGAWGCESGVVQAGKGPIQVFTWEERWRFQHGAAVGLSFQRRWGEALWPK